VHRTGIHGTANVLVDGEVFICSRTIRFHASMPRYVLAHQNSYELLFEALNINFNFVYIFCCKFFQSFNYLEYAWLASCHRSGSGQPSGQTLLQKVPGGQHIV
jgi:hypothetical protein